MLVLSGYLYGQCNYVLSWHPDTLATNYIVFIEFRDSSDASSFTLKDNMDFKYGAENFTIATTQDTTCTVSVTDNRRYVVYGVIGINSELNYGALGTIMPFDVFYAQGDPSVIDCEIVLPPIIWRKL